MPDVCSCMCVWESWILNIRCVECSVHEHICAILCTCESVECSEAGLKLGLAI